MTCKTGPLPKKGVIREIHAHGKVLVVKKTAGGKSWFAKVSGQRQGRFGNSRETREDICHFLTHGNLPRSGGGWS